MNELLSTSYDYELPKELIATQPITPKEDAKLLVYNRKDRSIIHSTFRDFMQFLPKETLLVFNDTKVIPARIYGVKIFQNTQQEGGKIEALFHKEISENLYLMQFRGRLKEGSRVKFEGGIFAKIIKDCGMGFKEASFFKIDDESPLDKQEFLGFWILVGIRLCPLISKEKQANKIEKNIIQFLQRILGQSPLQQLLCILVKNHFNNSKENLTMLL